MSDRGWRPDEPADPSALMTEFLVAVFVPAAVLFVALFAAVELAAGEALAAVHPAFAEPMRPKSGPGALASGGARFLLLVVVTTVLLVPYLGVYARYLRPVLRERGWV